MISLSDRVENIVGRGENAGTQYFLLFPQCFQEPFFGGSLKVGTVWYRVKQRHFLAILRSITRRQNFVPVQTHSICIQQDTTQIMEFVFRLQVKNIMVEEENAGSDRT